MSKIQFKESPFRIIVFSYLLFTIIFSLVYSLPFAHNGKLSFIDAWFLSSSAMSVTGLSTINITEQLTKGGQIVLLLQMQFGGIGIMVILGSFLFLFRQNVSLFHQTLMSFDQNQRGLKSVKQLILFILGMTVLIEVVFSLIIFPIVYQHDGDVLNSLFISFFHTTSSFTGSGFDLFGNSLISYSNSSLFLIITAFLIFCGAIGFPVILELLFSKGRKKSLYTKVNLLIHPLLVLVGFTFFLNLEFLPYQEHFNLKDKIVNSLFLSVSSRNAGLTTIDVSTLHIGSLMFVMILMFIGGSPSSCAGGIRTTTFSVLIAKTISIIKGREEVVMFKKSLYEEDVNKAHIVFFFFLTLFFVSTVALSFIEQSPIEFLSFEVMSALTSTGLSAGITSELNIVSKIWLSFLMIIGRIGIIALIYTLIKPKKSNARYIKEALIVG